MKTAIPILALGLLLGIAHAAAAQQPLLSNGDFETAKDDAPAGWKLAAGITWEKEGENRFLRLRSTEPGANVMVYRAIPITPDIDAMELKYKVRHENIVRGKQSWFDGRILLNFKDDKGNAVRPTPPHPSFVGTSANWQERAKHFRVPEGAVKLEMMLTLFQAKSGQLDFDDISLTALPVEVIEKEEAEARAKEAARIAALPKPKPQVPVPPADKLPSELRVVGNHLENAKGETVWLQGVAIPSLEWSAGGDHILKSIGVAMKDWKANCIRLPIGDNFYSGKGPHQNDGGMKYRQLVEDAVNLVATHGGYIVLDLHDFRAPKGEHVAFWQEVAAKYKNHPAVLFELFNEPHGISWEVWRNGGKVTDKKKSDVIAENDQPLNSFDSVGMQKLLETVRATGAKNIVIAGGLDWGYDLSGVTGGFALEDKSGNGVMYSSHVYPWKRNWQTRFLAAAEKHPIFIGEVGAEQEKLSFIPKEAQEDPATWVPDMLATIQKHKLNWTAWSFHPKAAPKALKDWNYTPTEYWGEHVKKALAGQSYELKKLR